FFKSAGCRPYAPHGAGVGTPGAHHCPSFRDLRPRFIKLRALFLAAGRVLHVGEAENRFPRMRNGLRYGA
ncbi:MAG: hypothetical protein N4A39_01485, partial [Roseicyclus sp.]|nr:hypothetical protein [Roseicyclus sp.]